MNNLKLFDLNPGSNGSQINHLTQIGDLFFFVANDGTTGREIWKFDPVVDSSPQLFDLNPGGNSSEPKYLHNINNVLFFSADILGNGRELWKFDPTKDTTPELLELNLGSDGSYPFFFTDVDGVAYGSADINQTQIDLWKFDSTTDIKPQLLNINSVDNSLSQSYFTSSQGIFYFVVNNGTKEAQLWKFDPKVDLSPQLFHWSLTDNFTVARVDWIDDKFYLTASESNVYEIWQFDPNTDLQPRQISLLNGDSSNLSYFSLATNINDTIFWISYSLNNFDGYHLWKFNPNTDNTVERVNNSNNSYQLVNIDGRLYLNIDDVDYGKELAVFDPAEEKIKVFNLNEGSNSSYVKNLIEIDGTLFFTANDGNSGNELWKFDPTVDSQPQLFDLKVGKAGSNPYSLVEVGENLYFATKVYDKESGSYQNQIWRSDGTEIGTYALGSIDQKKVNFERGLVEINNTIYFVAEDSNRGTELFGLDTTPALGKVEVVLEGGIESNFNFEGDWGSFTLNRNNSKANFIDQLPGVYTLDLNLPAGWMIDSVTITGENQSNSYSNGSGVVLGLDTSEDLTITYRLLQVIKGNGEANLLQSSVAAWIAGKAGDDTLRGSEGSDRLYGGGGEDWLSGGSGDDWLFGQKHDDTLYGNRGNDQLFGGNGNDSLLGGDDQDTLIGGGGDDTLRGGSGGDRLNGSAGNDLLEGNRGGDRLWGKGGSDTLKGGGDNDWLGGGGGKDRILGDTGDDTLQGHSGQDTLDGGSGQDKLFGGLDADVFVIGGDGSDRIMDYQPGIDRIKLDGLTYDQLTITTKKNHTLIEAFDLPIAIVKGTVDLDQSDFI